MKQKTILIVSIALTAFVLVTLGAVVNSALGKAAAEPAPVNSIEDLPPEIQQTLQEREDAYNQLIEDANTQLQQVMSQNQTLQAQIDNQADTTFEASVQDQNVISTDEALQIALDTVISSAVLDGEPELVDFEGAVAYEVPFKQGNLYIDAATGEVLFNGTIALAPAQISGEEAARIAANYLDRTDVYKVEMVSLNGNSVYKVKFNSGDVAFVNTTGQIVLVRLASEGGSSNDSGYYEDDHHDDDHDEHEHEDDD
jgi:uncharacterized membrane protein YkoI